MKSNNSYSRNCIVALATLACVGCVTSRVEDARDIALERDRVAVFEHTAGHGGSICHRFGSIGHGSPWGWAGATLTQPMEGVQSNVGASVIGVAVHLLRVCPFVDREWSAWPVDVRHAAGGDCAETEYHRGYKQLCPRSEIDPCPRTPPPSSSSVASPVAHPPPPALAV